MLCVLAENPFTEIFFEMNNCVQIRHFQKFHYTLSKISLHPQTVINQRLTVIQ